jgi:Uma2 family endonuclease
MLIAKRYRPHYTYEDYCQWEGSWELIDGMPYAMSPAPVPAHQSVSALLGFEFVKAMKMRKNCKLVQPLHWKIRGDTIVQPDLLNVCNKHEKKYLDFAPALVVEILSPATASQDRGEKMELYQSQKVKYYLIVDLQFKKLEIYEYIHTQYEPVALNPQSYQFELHDGCNVAVSLTDIWN